MKQIISKYQLTIADEQEIILPFPAKMIHVDTDPQIPDVPILWAMHRDPTEGLPEGFGDLKYPYIIRMIGTGIPFEETTKLLIHISTIHIRGGTYPLHCFIEGT